jgi:hypothetical protein
MTIAGLKSRGNGLMRLRRPARGKGKQAESGIGDAGQI